MYCFVYKKKHINLHLVELHESFIFRPYDYKLDEKWIGSAKPEWYHYFLCGWKGILDHFKLPPLGMNVLLSGSYVVEIAFVSIF